MAQDRAGVRKAAILLLSLGVEPAAATVRHLDPSRVYEVIYEASNLAMVSPEETRAVLQEFLKMVPTAVGTTEGKRFAHEVLRRTFGDQGQSVSLDFLKQIDRSQLIDIVEREHPQVAAFLLAFIEPDQAAAVLAELPPQVQVDLSRRIARMAIPRREALGHLARVFSNRLGSLVAEGIEVGGVESLVNIMRGVGRTAEQNILGGLAEAHPDLAEEIKKKMFVFEDLAGLDDASLQRLLKEVDGKVLALALKRCSAEIVERLMANLSERARNLLREELDTMGKVRLREVEQAQSEVVSVARRLEQAGEIQLHPEEEEYV